MSSAVSSVLYHSSRCPEEQNWAISGVINITCSTLLYGWSVICFAFLKCYVNAVFFCFVLILYQRIACGSQFSYSSTWGLKIALRSSGLMCLYLLSTSLALFSVLNENCIVLLKDHSLWGWAVDRFSPQKSGPGSVVLAVQIRSEFLPLGPTWWKENQLPKASCWPSHTTLTLECIHTGISHYYRLKLWFFFFKQLETELEWSSNGILTKLEWNSGIVWNPKKNIRYTSLENPSFWKLKR